jgi:hypothetical protein
LVAGAQVAVALAVLVAEVPVVVEAVVVGKNV